MFRKTSDGVGVPLDTEGRPRTRPQPSQSSRLPGDEAGDTGLEDRAKSNLERGQQQPDRR